jgi:hypothetical protein
MTVCNHRLDVSSAHLSKQRSHLLAQRSDLVTTVLLYLGVFVLNQQKEKSCQTM